MDSTTQFLITLLSSSAIAAVISGVVIAVMQKRNERESRLFNAKLEAYKEFVAHLESKFITLVDDGKTLDVGTLGQISAKCLLVSNAALNAELKKFLAYVADVYKKCSEPDFDVESEKPLFIKLVADADKVGQLMRDDLGFK